MFKWQRKLKAPRVLLWIGIVVLVGAAGFGMQLLVRQLQRVNEPEKGAPPAVREVQDLANTGTEEEVDKKIVEKLQDPSVSGDEKYLLYQQQGSRFMSKNDATAAVDAYLKGFEIRQTFEMAQAVAGAYWRAGNREKAIEYYRKAIELVPADHAVRGDEIDSMNMMIKMIEEGK